MQICPLWIKILYYTFYLIAGGYLLQFNLTCILKVDVLHKAEENLKHETSDFKRK